MRKIYTYKDAYELGKKAKKEGKKTSQNPFNSPDFRLRWLEGYNGKSTYTK